MRTPPLSAVFSPSVSLPLTFAPGATENPPYSSATQASRWSNSSCVLRVSTSSCRLPWASNWRPWSSKPWVSSWPITMPMPPKFTASSIVVVEEGRLQNAGGEIDVVHLRIVIGVDRGRRHVPFLAVHGLADLVQLALELELVGAETVAHGVVALDHDAGIVAPVVRIADLVGDGLQLDQGLLLWSPASSSRASRYPRPAPSRARPPSSACAPCPRRRRSARRICGPAPRPVRDR